LEEKPKEYALEYAGFWVRLGASLIDGIILGSIVWIIIHAFAAQGLGYNMASFCRSSGDVIFSYSFISAPVIWSISWLIKIAYFAGFWKWRGQTPGKMVMGIKVIRTDSSPVSWPHALLRYLGYMVSTMILFIGFIWIAFDGRKQGIHDKIADTYVVKLPVKQVILTESFARGGVG